MRIVSVLMSLLVCSVITSQAQTSPITWISPEDGGTPRDFSKIKQVSPQEFHIQAVFEEGGTSILKHAVSRMDLICHNSNNKPVILELHIDLSQENTRTDYDTKPEGGMKLRDFLFIQKPGSNTWQQINGRTEGWVSITAIEVLPGDTKVGLSPWYTYALLQERINGNYLLLLTSKASGLTS